MKLLLLFLLYLFPEILITSQFAEAFGGFWLFAEIVASGALGIFILANFRFAVMENLRALSEGRIGEGAFMAAQLFRLVGAIFLILPGLMTDGLGLLLQLEGLAGLVAGLFSARRRPSGFKEPHPYHTNPINKGESSEIIDVEIIDTPDPRR